MKQFAISLFALLMFVTNLNFGQTKTKPKAPVKKPTAATVPMPSPVGNWFKKSANGQIDSLVIKSDSTYRFATYQTGVSTPESFSGTWKVKKNDVFLHIANTNEPYGQIRAVVTTAGTIELFKVVRYFGNLQKAADQMELRNK